MGICGDEFVATPESNWHTDRIRFCAAMTCLNGENFSIHFKSRHTIVATFHGTRKRESKVANSFPAH